MHAQKKCYLSFYTSDLYSLLHINPVNPTGWLPFYVSIMPRTSIHFQIIFQVYTFAHNFLSIRLHWLISNYLWPYSLFWDETEMSLYSKTTLLYEEWRKDTASLIYKSKLFFSLIDILRHVFQFRSPIFQTFTWWYFTKNPLL